MRRRWIVWGIGLATMALVGAGCSGDSEDGAQSSPEAVIAAYFDALSVGDLETGYALISPERREGVTQSDWSTCMAGRLDRNPPGSVYRYEHTSTSTEQGSTIAEGRVTAEADGAVWADSFVRFAVADIDGEWYAVAALHATEPECIDIARDG